MIRIAYHPEAPLADHYAIDPATPEIWAAVAAIRHWGALPDLAHFAVARHGYGDTDAGFGVIYPTDRDEYDTQVLGEHIATGHVQIYGFWGPPAGYEIELPEATYLEVLAAVLHARGHHDDALSVTRLLTALRGG